MPETDLHPAAAHPATGSDRHPVLDAYIDQVNYLPPAPQILPELLHLLGEPDIDSGKIVSLITYDPALTAGVLHLCNSAFCGAATSVTDVQEAVTRLGFQQVYILIAAISGARTLSPVQKGYGIEAGELWKHSVTTAVAAQLLARDLGDNQHLVFTAALLHDIGKILLAGALERCYARLVAETENRKLSLIEIEKKLLGVHHAEIGGRLLARWRFPANLVSAVWFHHNPLQAAPHQRLAAYLYVGNLIAYFMGHGYGNHAYAKHEQSEVLDLLQLAPDALPQYMIKTFDRFDVINALFSLEHQPALARPF